MRSPLGFISELDCYLFGNGTHYSIYEKLGAHPATIDGKKGVYFAVWAPKAAAVHVVGDFNDWDKQAVPMTPISTSGIWEAFCEGIGVGAVYKFAVTTSRGEVRLKSDPYARQSELRPNTASVVANHKPFCWSDTTWLEKRKTTDPKIAPLSVYEVHLPSWTRNSDKFKSYRQLAKDLGDYVKAMGYTHVELMGIAEHPFDGSWGYQVTGYYAPTSRHGSPEEFKYFINQLHRRGIGVILDWVPAHFPKDAHGLAEFDGTPTYEYADTRKGEQPDWGTKVFDFEKTEVKNFLIANALYWVEEFHIDGLRVDAVSSMLYLNYGRKNGNWATNCYGGTHNLEAIEFFRHLNSMMKQRNPGVMTIAEEATSWAGVTDTPENGGLGFTFKWNMGWMHDFLEYMKQDPIYRKFHHNKMTFAMTYTYSEDYVLVLSHDEVVHLKCSMLTKMPGYRDDKFANLKAGYTFMMGHPGKKLLFMGQEFGQWREWSEARELDWFLLNEPGHESLRMFYRDLLHMYKKYPCLWEGDHDPNSFQWINCDDADRSIFSWVRKSKDGKDNLLFVCNFTPMERSDYKVGAPCQGKYTLILDNRRGTVGYKEPDRVYKAYKGECDCQPCHIDYPLPPYGIAVFRFDTKKV